MTTTAFGYAVPLKYDEAKPGMLISASTPGGRHVLGLAFQGDREILLAVFRQNGEPTEPEPPYVVDLTDVHQTLTGIIGDREFEPAGLAFELLPQRKVGIEGFVITSQGTIGLAVVHHDFGQPKFRMLDFDTGLDLKHGGSVAVIPEPRIYIRGPGRDQRFELTLTPTA
ncbi:MAG: hypothetical protein ACK4MI_03555 [Brevundimonas sp.]|uniref:hypothetical protein n=1 Tax=Brevundimonas sp. TaxID=1871086 RepID=UPI00391DA2D4